MVGVTGVTVMKETGGDGVAREHQAIQGKAATVDMERRLRMQVVTNSQGHMELNLHGRGLRQVPVQVFHMGSIHVLRLAHNHIDHLPMMISYLRSLRVLDVSHNALAKLPETLVNCRSLSRLDVSHNRLAGLPRTVGGLRELRHLGLAGNLLEQLQQEVGQLVALRVLNLHGNRLWHLPPSLERLRHLSRLDLGDNMLDSVPLVVTRITSLKALDLSRNRLNALPVDIDKLKGLVELNLSHNKFPAITSLLATLTKLKYLSLAGNGLKFLPTQIDRLQNLEVLHLQGNSLKSIPALPSSIKYYNERRATFPRSRSRSSRLTEKPEKPRSSNEVKPPKRFSSLRSFRDILFGRSKNKNRKELPSHDGASGSINFETRAALKPSDSVHLPINYRMEDIEGDMRSNRRFSGGETRNFRPPQHFQHSPMGSPVESFYSTRNHTRGHHKGMDDGGEYKFEGHYRNAYNNTKRSRYQQGISNTDMTHSSTMLPEFHHRILESQGYPNLQQGRLRQGGSLRGKWPERYRKNFNHHSAKGLGPASTMPFRHSQSWVGQERMFSRGQNSPQAPQDSFSSEASWREWGRSVPRSAHASRDHSVREAYASFATETPYSERASPDGRAIYFPELDFANDSADDGYTSPMRSYRSEPILHNDVENMSFKTHTRGSRLASRQRFPSDDSLFDQEFDEETRVKQSHGHNHLDQSWHDASPVSDQSFEREHAGLRKSNSLNFLHAEVRDNGYHGSSRSASRVTDYIDCEDTSVSAVPPPRPGSSKKGHFSQFDNILSTAAVPHEAAETGRGSPRLTPVALQHGHFLMKRKPTDHMTTTTRRRSLDSILDDRSQNMNTAGAQHSNRRANQDPERHQDEHSGRQLDLGPAESVRSHISEHSSSTGSNKQPVADLSLLGVCSHVETMLNRNAFQPGIRFNKNYTQRNTGQTPRDDRTINNINATGEDAHHTAKTLKAWGLKYSQPKTFTLTSSGGQFVSSSHLEVLVDVPAHAVRRNLNMTMQLLTISPELLSQAQEANHFVSNILSLGPLVYFYTNRPQVSLNSPATINLPAPAAVKGGHLVVLSVRKDNSCLPVSSGYRSGHTAATMTTWHFSGKMAVIARAKCKYKACKSVEQLLQCIGAAQI
ncbi:leucine rich repeat protein [Elysia marginata]|uniref:Leucine rich repeat protein n=1 Tax=Elysia marginata TaxID=1093978 RepID=A0AAV4HKN1_9GAST|nr:leucine rich repeat protein [Elysia marginata]